MKNMEPQPVTELIFPAHPFREQERDRTPCEGECKFKITIEYDYNKVGVDKQITRFKFKMHEEGDSQHCDAEFGEGRGKIDFKEKGRRPCRIRNGDDFIKSSANCGATVTGVSELEKTADFGFIDIDIEHDLECSPIPPCEGKPTTGVMRVQFSYNSGTGESPTHNGVEPPDPPGPNGTKTVTFEKTLKCSGTKPE